MNNQHLIYTLTREFFGSYLTGVPGLTEIAVNQPDTVFLKVRGQWIKQTQSISFQDCLSFASALADYCTDSISETKPILSATLPGGERVQVVIPSATAPGTVSVTIRKPSDQFISHDDFVQQGFYSRMNTRVPAAVSAGTQKLIALYQENDVAGFITGCLSQGKTLAICGGTGSGKTTFSNALLAYIPPQLRIVSIEDTPEIQHRFHENHVKLFYPAEGGKNSLITPAMLLRACFRMNPDRILMTEIRGGEAWDFMKGISSGHSGGITTVHEETPEQAVSGIIERCAQNPECRNLPYNVLLRKVLNNIDVIMSIKYFDTDDTRYATGLYFKDLHFNEYYEKLRG